MISRVLKVVFVGIKVVFVDVRCYLFYLLNLSPLSNTSSASSGLQGSCLTDEEHSN